MGRLELTVSNINYLPILYLSLLNPLVTVFTSTNVKRLVVQHSITPELHIKSVMSEENPNDGQHTICFIQVLKFYIESTHVFLLSADVACIRAVTEFTGNQRFWVTKSMSFSNELTTE